MRFLKRQTINRRQLKDTTVYSDVDAANVYINPRNSGSMVLPMGTNAQTPSSPVNGMMRYNVDIVSGGEVQVYQNGYWRSLKYKEPSKITVQNAGTGNGVNTVFPLSPQPATVAASGVTWNEAQWAKNIIVIVGNVIQIAGTNYDVVKGEDITIGPDALGPYTAGTKYLKFTSYVPGVATPEVVTVIHGLDQ